METWHRYFAYITGALVFGLLIIVFTNSFFGFVNNPGWVGLLVLSLYGLIFVNLSYVMNRRFTEKLPRPSPVSWVMAALLVLPTLLWIYTKETPLAESRMVFTVTIIFATSLGAYFGIKAGSRKRDHYLQEEEADDLPDDLRRSHDELNRN